MPHSQPGILAQGTRFHHHLEFDLLRGASESAVAAALWSRHGSASAGGTNVVVGFGAGIWRRVRPDAAPAGLRPFSAVDGAGGRGVPATQHDVWVWLHGSGPDTVLDEARAVTASLSGIATLVAEQQCYAYRDSRDLTGFIDGTENPTVDDAPEVVLVPDTEPGAGGTFAITMRWVHDLAAFDAQSLVEQERTIGRTKLDSVELDDDVKPPTAHIARVVVEDDAGEEMEIYRRSVPYGGVSEHGLFFVAFSRDLERFDLMLQRMYGLSGDGVHDRLIEFTRPVSSSYYFVPSLEDLAAAGATGSTAAE